MLHKMLSIMVKFAWMQYSQLDSIDLDMLIELEALVIKFRMIRKETHLQFQISPQKNRLNRRFFAVCFYHLFLALLPRCSKISKGYSAYNAITLYFHWPAREDSNLRPLGS